MGYQPDLLPFYRSLDLFVLNSLREGLPNVLLEAMAMRVPVIATRTGGVPQLVEDQITGRLIEPGHSGQLRQAILDSMSQSADRQRLVDAGDRISKRIFRSTPEWNELLEFTIV